MFIAEIGINHNGDLNIAKELIRQAKMCGVDIVKFQKRNPELCVPENQKNIIKDTVFGVMKYIDYKRKIEFGRKEYDEIDKYCKEIGIKWTASVWDIDSLDFIMQYNVPFIKIPSACIIDLELLDKINLYKKDVILSNGMSTEEELFTAINNLPNCKNIGILHCNSSYPSSKNELDLDCIKILNSIFCVRKYHNFTIGYSGHEEGYFPTLLARAVGASIIERHITLSKTMKGSDHKSSLDMNELKDCIEKLKEVDIILGKNYKTVYESEKKVKEKLRRF